MEFDLSDARKLSLYSDSLTVLQDRLFLLLLTEEMDAEEFNPNTFTPATDADGVPVPNQTHIKSLGLQVERLRAQIATLRGE
jgi:hypothetical protein